MAIDYKKEWEKLIDECGALGVNIPHEAVSVTLQSLMENQINATINEREKLMEEYVKDERITTNIDGGERHFHNVQVIDKAHGKTYWLIGTINVHKADFNTWCKKKREKEMEAMQPVIRR
ncbi:hypothetical protein ES703_97795 [subsurface metagenome]